VASAISLSGAGVFGAWENVAASATDEVLVAAIPGRKIRVLTFLINQGSTTASTVTFNSKGSGSGTAISPTLLYAANGGTSADTVNGFWETKVGEALTVSTGAGSTTGIAVSCKSVPG
jgi:hypothetical protein